MPPVNPPQVFDGDWNLTHVKIKPTGQVLTPIGFVHTSTMEATNTYCEVWDVTDWATFTDTTNAVYRVGPDGPGGASSMQAATLHDLQKFALAQGAGAAAQYHAAVYKRIAYSVPNPATPPTITEWSAWGNPQSYADIYSGITAWPDNGTPPAANLTGRLWRSTRKHPTGANPGNIVTLDQMLLHSSFENPDAGTNKAVFIDPQGAWTSNASQFLTASGKSGTWYFVQTWYQWQPYDTALGLN